jgi:hypothetical protein
VTRSFRPEVVLFGRDQQLDTPLMLDVGRHILVTASSESDKLKLSRFAIGEEDQVAECSRKVADVVRTAVKLGATYPDIVSMLQQAADRQNLQARVEVDALPEGGRVLARDRREIPDDRPGLFPTEFVSETAPHDAQADRDDSPDGDADTTTEIGPASDENFDATAPDFDTLLGGPGS